MPYGPHTRKASHLVCISDHVFPCYNCALNTHFTSSLLISDQLPVSTKYDLRSDPGVEKNYGKLLLEMVSVVPDGIVCFFVSYSYMDGIVNSWHETGLLKVRQ